MAKVLHDNVYDLGLDTVKTNAKKLAVMSAASTVATACESATVLAIATLTTNSFTIQDGAVSGRRITVAQQTTVAVQATGIADTIAIFSTGATGIVYMYTTCSTQALTSTSNTVTVPSFSIELRDPS